MVGVGKEYIIERDVDDDDDDDDAGSSFGRWKGGAMMMITRTYSQCWLPITTTYILSL